MNSVRLYGKELDDVVES